METKTHLFIFDAYDRAEREYNHRVCMLDELSIRYHSKYATTIVFIVEFAPEPYEMIYQFKIVNDKNKDYTLRGVKADCVIIDEYVTLDRETKNYLRWIER